MLNCGACADHMTGSVSKWHLKIPSSFTDVELVSLCMTNGESLLICYQLVLYPLV